MEEEDHHDDHHDRQATEPTTQNTANTNDNDNENDNSHADASISSHGPPDEESAISLPPLPDLDDSALNPDTSYSLHHPSSDLDYAHHHDNQTILDEKEMQQKLMDIESSFLPEPSTIDVAPPNANAGADDTYLVGIGEERGREEEEEEKAGEGGSFSFNDIDAEVAGYGDNSIGDLQEQHHANEEEEELNDLDATPGPRNRLRDYSHNNNTSTLETLTSSPITAAAERTVSRVLSAASKNIIHNSSGHSRDGPPSLTPKKSRRNLSPTTSESRRDPFVENEDDSKLSRTPSERRRSRPRYLTSRQSSHRFSMSSVNSANTDTTTSDATLGVDFALQSGGAISNSANKSRKDLSRSISLGSMASGVSGLSEENVFDKRVASGATDGGLHTLDEEDSGSVPPAHDEDNLLMTPKAAPREVPLPTDTAIAARVEDIQVPGTFARQFREKFSASMSPEKRAAGAPTPAFGRSGRSLTLKEQSSTIDRLSKENFDLKMRIHFLNEALNKRSEEGIKEMISENVELKSDKLKLQKDNQGMKRTIRDLEKRLKDRQAGKDSTNQDGETDEEAATEEEIVFLRERIETYEVELERLRSEVFHGENEKRRLAEVVRSMGDSRPAGSETGAREERVSFITCCRASEVNIGQDMWKDMLDAETAAREQADEENRRLRDEILRMKAEASLGSEAGRYGRSGRKGSFISHSSVSERDQDRRLTVPNSASTTLVEIELLKQENAELRREVSAQTSMLTSRNREKDRLYQEIEDLKLQRRDGARSITGDSIFERSASRAHARSPSRASNGTRTSASDTERDNLEIRNGELRDQVSTLKLENQGLRGQLDEYTTELETLDKAYQADVDQAEEEIQSLQQERDQAYRIAEEREAALQDLKHEAQEEIDALGDELDQKIDECQRLEVDLRTQEDSLKTLQAEMRSASEGILRLEEDAQSNLRKYKTVQQELEDSNREIDSLEKSLFEANTKVQRLTVQLESSQNEISFLREEQDGDKIRISDLDSELKTCQINLQAEREKAKDLEARLAEERHQREVVASKEKQEVQRIMNDLNRESSTAKDEVRRLKKTLYAREIEASTWKERLMELENGLREALGDLNGTRSSLLNSIIKLQKELESTALELESTRAKLDEKESILQNRDSLLESHGLESRKLADLLERERQARRADKHSFDQALKSQQQASRTITQNNSRITDLENARGQDRKRFASLEQQLKDQLNERNTLYLNLWKRLSGMCGPDWAHSNSLINGNLPSVEVIGNILFWPGFSRNLLLALKTVEGMLSGFKNRIRAVERDLTKEYQSLEHNLGLRIKKLDRVEEAVRNIRAQQRASTTSPEVSKLKTENRLLKAELNLMQQPHSRNRHSGSAGAAVIAANVATTDHELDRSPVNRSAQSDSRKGIMTRNASGTPQPSNALAATTQSQRSTALSNAEQDRLWVERLRELERRLKAEREARMVDRNGARKRLEERVAENMELRAELERERLRRGQRALESGNTSSHSHSHSHSHGHSYRHAVESGPNSGSDVQRSSDNDTDAHSSYGEGITVDIEM
ncbi:hypothetical protein PISL3812_00639 [Talaromyces islandicus]|uniref:Anucleate primary sterigmata protein B n=1 Tax=Talaromyces islandicus TaxID=28573 RepID=A0A0U1LJV8_TALIS|nr:hypothetical protein PISL3812_00639 [Talaromyces islandicus]